MASNSRFRFCGEILIPSSDRNPFIKRDTVQFSSGSVPKISINFGVKNGANCPYVGLQGFKHSTIKTRSKDNESIEIEWENRFDPDVVANVSRNSKFIVNLTERKEFITEWDMIEYLENELPKFKEDVVVRGRFVRRPGTGEYAGKFYDNFNIDSVLAASKVEDSSRSCRVTADLYYNKDCVDTADFKTNGIIHVSAYVPMWITSERAEMMVPFAVEFDPRNIQIAHNEIGFDPTTPQGKEQVQYYVDEILGRKSKDYVKMRWSVNVVNGAEEKPFDESCLTSRQKREIELGLSTIEDFRPLGTVYGPAIREFKLHKNAMRGDTIYNDGPVEAYTVKEFEELIYHPPVVESADDVFSDVTETDDADDLFD